MTQEIYLASQIHSLQRHTLLCPQSNCGAGCPAAPLPKAPPGLAPRCCRSCPQPLLSSACCSLYTSPRPALEIQIQHLLVKVRCLLGFGIDLVATATFHNVANSNFSTWSTAFCVSCNSMHLIGEISKSWCR